MNDNCFEYTIVRKRVKKYSIRVMKDGTVLVTIPLRGSVREAERFLESKADWIIEKLSEQRDRIRLDSELLDWGYLDERHFRLLTYAVRERFAAYDIPIPKLRFRKMKGSWGNCRKKTADITYNKLLKLVPAELQEYVVAHELSHLVESNHSPAFYRVLSSVLPDHRSRERKLKEYMII